MDNQIVIATSLMMGLLAWGLVARWYVLPALANRPRTEALVPLILPHVFRYIGLAFLLPGVVATDIDARFTHPAAFGDLAAALLALLALAALRMRWKAALPLVWVFGIVGTLDRLYAVTTGIRVVDTGQFGGAYFIPALIVPFLLVSHGLIFRTLLRELELPESRVGLSSLPPR